MFREPLQVRAGHLHGLAARHGQAANEIASATEAVCEVDRGIRTSHGVVASSTADAVAAVQKARCRVARSVAGQSRALHDHLIAAAGHYETTDVASGAELDSQLTSRPVPPTEGRLR